MQKTERIGAVALLFLIVTIVAVALWDDGGGEDKPIAKAQPEQASEPVRAQQQRATRQRPQAQTQATRQQRDRHEDGLRSTRAADRREGDWLLGSAGEAAPVRTQRAPLLTEKPQQQAGAQAAVVEENSTVAEGAEGPLVRNGWDNGRKPRVEETLSTLQQPPAAPRERSSRKRKVVAAQAAAKVQAGGQTHTVKGGETLGGIAHARLGRASRWPEIAIMNGIKGHEIQVGQSLRLPGDATSSSSVGGAAARVLPKARVASSASGSRTYVIRKGDVLGAIAQRELGSSKRWREILSLNPSLNEKKLSVGTKILLPRGTRSTAPQKSLLASASGQSEYQVR